MSSTSLIKPEDIEFFNENGFLVIPNLFPQSELDLLRDEMNRLIDNYDFEAAAKATFETGVDKQTNDDAYFLASGRKISFFLEPNSTNDKGELLVPKHEAFNKVAHGLHDLNPVFEKFSYNPSLLSIVRALGHINPQIVQSMYIFKSAKVGGEVTPHQDSSFVQTSPRPTCIGTWVSLQDANENNGCMYFVPGSHKKPLERFFNLDEDGKGCSFNVSSDFKYDISAAIPVPVTAGSLVLIHGGVIHFSGHNYSDANRNAYSLHVVESGDEVVYPKTNWLQPTPELPFRSFDEISRKIYPEAFGEDGKAK